VRKCRIHVSQHCTSTKRELYATLLPPRFQVHRHIKVITYRCIHLPRPGGPHPSARGIRIVSTQRTIDTYETSDWRALALSRGQFCAADAWCTGCSDCNRAFSRRPDWYSAFTASSPPPPAAAPRHVYIAWNGFDVASQFAATLRNWTGSARSCPGRRTATCTVTVT